MDEALTAELAAITICLTAADEVGLQTEVVQAALRCMKENPKLTVTDAINLGLNEWVK